jgi:hypothetical protein
MKVFAVKLELECRVARFFVIQYTKTVKIYQITTNIPKGHTVYIYVYQMTVIYSQLP